MIKIDLKFIRRKIRKKSNTALNVRRLSILAQNNVLRFDY